MLRSKIERMVKSLSINAFSVPKTFADATAHIMDVVGPEYQRMWEQLESAKKEADEWHATAERYATALERERRETIPEVREFQKPVKGDEAGTEYLSVAKNTLVDQVNAFVSEVELGAVKCRCEWLIHPDDGHLSPDQQRKRRGMESEFCAQHSKRGLVLGLFEYLFGEEEMVIPADQTAERSRLYAEYQTRLQRRLVGVLIRKGYPDNQAHSLVHDLLPTMAGDFRGAWELIDQLKQDVIRAMTSPRTAIIGSNTGEPIGFLTAPVMSQPTDPCGDRDVHPDHDWSQPDGFVVHCPGVEPDRA